MTSKVTAVATNINNVFKPKENIRKDVKDAAIFGLAAGALTGATSGVAAKIGNIDSIAFFKGKIKEAKKQNLGQEVIKEIKADLKTAKKLINKIALKTAGAAALMGAAAGFISVAVKKAMYNDVMRTKNGGESVQKPADEQ